MEKGRVKRKWGKVRENREKAYCHGRKNEALEKKGGGYILERNGGSGGDPLPKESSYSESGKTSKEMGRGRFQ